MTVMIAGTEVRIGGLLKRVVVVWASWSSLRFPLLDDVLSVYSGSAVAICDSKVDAIRRGISDPEGDR